MSRPANQRPGLVAVVALGGAVGTAARFGLARAVPAIGGWPTATFVANLTGAFLLGLLLEALLARGPETPATRRVRLALGTGLLGGFTTFSSLAIEVERLAAQGDAGLGVGYGLLSVVLGFGCALAGVAVGGRRAARPATHGPGDAR